MKHPDELQIIAISGDFTGRTLTTTRKAFEAIYKKNGYEEFDPELHEVSFDEGDLFGANKAPFIEVTPKFKKLSGAAKAAAERKARQQG